MCDGEGILVESLQWPLLLYATAKYGLLYVNVFNTEICFFFQYVINKKNKI